MDEAWRVAARWDTYLSMHLLKPIIRTKKVFAVRRKALISLPPSVSHPRKPMVSRGPRRQGDRLRWKEPARVRVWDT